MDNNKTDEAIPAWVSEEIKATWTAMQGAGQTEAYRIMERMVKRIGYGDLRDPALTPNQQVSRDGGRETK